jgi:membrane peptidoglycan carboxypeptidase
MVEERVISAEEARAAKDEPLAFAAAPFPIRAPHFVMYVRRFLERELGRAALEAGGLTIETTLDVALNETARDLMRTRLAQLARCHYEDACPPGGYNVRNAAVLALSPQTGEVLAMVGSPDYFSPRIDGAVNASTVLRQPGSSIKPITYAAAFARGGMTPATVVMDVRTAFTTREGTPYLPLNYDLVFHGPVRLREALASSYNVTAVKVLDAIGIETMTGLARAMGITTFDDSERLGLSVTLGGGEVRLLELAAAYGALANQGRHVTPWAVRRVVDADGAVLWAHPCAAGARTTARCLGPEVLDARVAYLITDILSDDHARVPTFGEASVLNLPYPAAVKTGTTTDFRDNWTVGYTPELVVGVWVGNADNERMKRVTGVTGAGPLWHDVMAAALKGKPVRPFIRPDGLTHVEVCALSGALPTPDCPHRVHEWFVAGTEPRTPCRMHRRAGGEVVVVLPPEARAWAREHNLAPPPDRTSPDARAVRITRPYTGTVYRLDPALDRDAQRILVEVAVPGAPDAVTLTVDDRPIATLTAPPYAVHWRLVEGAHTFRAAVRQADGSVSRSAPVRIDVEP